MERNQRNNKLTSALKTRSKRFAIQVIVLCRHFPRSLDGIVIAKQLIRAATSTAANYRAACRARSPAEFVAKIGVVAEEADESEFWLELSMESKLACGEHATALLREAGELTAISTASRDTAKRNLDQEKHEHRSDEAVR